MKLIQVLLITVLCFFTFSSASATVEDEWKEFKIKFKKTYKTPEEEQKKLEVFKENLDFIRDQNEKKTMTFRVGVNQDTDLNYNERVDRLKTLSKFWKLWYQIKRYFTARIILSQSPTFNESFEEPNAVDWRDRGAVTEVKDQGQCGSCYAFSSVAALESHHFIKTSKLLNLSEQEVVDCSSLNYGCGGGLEFFAYNDLIKTGISLSSDYPYKAKKGKCINNNFPRSEVKVYGTVGLNGEDKLMNILAQFGPVSVAVNALPKSFQFYKEGIYNDPMSNQTSLNHAVLAVGYGRDEDLGMDYWIIKNSWSKDWGENGYMRLERNNKTFEYQNMLFPLLNDSAKD